MSKPRPLDYDELQRMRDQGMTWKAIADELHWSAASLRDRLNRDGWHERPPYMPREPEPTQKAGKKPPLKELVYGWLKAGAEPETVAKALGKSLGVLSMQLRVDMQVLKEKARAEASIELAEAIYERAKSGDRGAIATYKRSLLC